MITEYKKCRNCGSVNLLKNGKTSAGKQRFYCKDCNSYGTLKSSRKSEEEKNEILNVYKERASLRGIQRVYGVAPKTIISWIKKKCH